MSARVRHRWPWRSLVGSADSGSKTAGTGLFLHGSGAGWPLAFHYSPVPHAVGPPSAQLVSVSLSVCSVPSDCFMPTVPTGCLRLHAPSVQQPPCIGLAPVKQTRQALSYAYATRSISSQSTARWKRGSAQCGCATGAVEGGAWLAAAPIPVVAKAKAKSCVGLGRNRGQEF